MKNQTRNAITDLLASVIEKKLASYTRESSNMPFAVAMFGEEVTLTASVVQSLYTTFGMSTYEQIAVLLASGAGFHAERQHILMGEVDPATSMLIDSIVRRTGQPNSLEAIAAIKESVRPGRALKDRESVVDVFVRKPKGDELYIDITTAKPNKKEFQALREKILRWHALRMSTAKNVSMRACIGIPYNPYHPEPYTRWTAACCDGEIDLLVQEQMWQAISGENVYAELLDIFGEVGRRATNDIRKFLSTH